MFYSNSPADSQTRLPYNVCQQAFTTDLVLAFTGSIPYFGSSLENEKCSPSTKYGKLPVKENISNLIKAFVQGRTKFVLFILKSQNYTGSTKPAERGRPSYILYSHVSERSTSKYD